MHTLLYENEQKILKPLLTIYQCVHISYFKRPIFHIVWSGRNCDQNGDRVSTYDKSCHICSMRLNRHLVKYEKYGTLSMYI